jgi:RHS repeat-associated protein
MPVWRVSEPYISLWLHDIPLFYRDSSGHRVSLRLKYNHRGTPKPAAVAGFGDKWECDWFGFLQQTTNIESSGYITNFLAGGGHSGFSLDGTNEYKSGSSLKIETTNAVLRIETPIAQRRNYGNFLHYSDATLLYFLTNHTDQQGKSVQYTYTYFTNVDTSVVVRPTEMKDKDGKTCAISFTNTAFPNLITSVSDPYSRSAYFIYDSFGRLTNIIDIAGLHSSFQYDTDGSITNLHTDYGDTRFRYFWGTNSTCDFNRAIEITEANTAKQLYVYRDMFNPDLNDFGQWADNDSAHWPYRNSFHWNRQQYAALSDYAKTNVLDMPDDDYKKGSLKHWLHGAPYGGEGRGIVSGTLSAVAGPVVNTVPDMLNFRVNGVYFNYVGGNTAYIGPLRAVTQIHWDFDQNQMDIDRNKWGRPTQFTYHRYTGNVTFSNEFNADGRTLKRVWGPNGEMIRGYGYDATYTNLLTSVTNAVGDEIHYAYDSARRLISVTNSSGIVRSNTLYTSGTFAGFPQATAYVGFRTNYFTYENGNVLVRTNELGLATTNIWDALNRLRCTTFPDGTTISNSYDKLDLVGVKDRMGYWTTYSYNGIRQLLARTNANGQLRQYDYCDCGALSQIIDWNGTNAITTQFGYDLAGRLTNTVHADGYFLSYIYTDATHERGGPIRIEDSSGLAVHYEYGDYRSVKKIGLSRVPDTSPDAYLISRGFDEYGRVISSLDRNGIASTTGYDFMGRVISNIVWDAYSQPRSTNFFLYTARGLTNSVDALGYTTTFVRDSLGRVLSRTNANNEPLQFTYNASDEILSLTDAKNQTTAWHHDEYGRATNKVDAATNVIFRYNYDADGRLTNRWTPAKTNVFFRYDPIGNLTNVDYPGSTLDIVFQYDGLNRLTNMVDGMGATKYNYNLVGQLLSEDGPWNDDTVSYIYNNRRRVGMSLAQPNASPWVQSYAYDQYNRLTNTTSSAGQFGYVYSGTLSDLVSQLLLPGYSGGFSFFIENQYDGLARLTNTTLHTPFDSTANYHAYDYDNANRRSRQTFRDANYVDYTYDPIGQLKTAKGWESGGSTARLHEQFGYGYDSARNLSNRTNNALVQRFNVNNLNELTTETNSGTLTVAGTVGSAVPTTSVTVSGTGLASGAADLYADATWVRAGANFVSGNNSYTASATDGFGRASSDSVTVDLPSTNNFSYDLNGNLLSDGLRTFEYDFENQLTNVFVTNGWRSEFKYDGFMRRRVRREFAWQAGTWQLTNELHYVYDHQLVVQERDGNNLGLVTYTRGLDIGRSFQEAGGIGGLLARTDSRLWTLDSGLSSADAYYHCDAVGNVTALVNRRGAVVARYSYDPFGNTLAMGGPLAQANLYRFSSKEVHVASGLLYYLYRFYDGVLQRWVNRDPIQEDGGAALYAFNLNQPSGLVDFYGLCGGGSDLVPPVYPGLLGIPRVKDPNTHSISQGQFLSQLGRGLWESYKDDPSASNFGSNLYDLGKTFWEDHQPTALGLGLGLGIGAGVAGGFLGEHLYENGQKFSGSFTPFKRDNWECGFSCWIQKSKSGGGPDWGFNCQVSYKF